MHSYSFLCVFKKLSTHVLFKYKEKSSGGNQILLSFVKTSLALHF